MLTGGCYCGAVRYGITGQPVMSAQCHCRPCQYFSGGGPNYFMLVPPEGFAYTAGNADSYRRSDLENSVTREFCSSCGTHLITRRPGLELIIVKAGTLDEPSAYGRPRMAIFCAEMASFHSIPEGVPAFQGLPERR
jgi:hypothetical protein